MSTTEPLLPCPFCGGAPDDQITRLKDAIEGECHGLVISDEQARAILDYVLGARPNFVAPDELADIPDYDAGLLNDWGGGNVDWWHDYLRAEIERANDYWRGVICSSLIPPTEGNGWQLAETAPDDTEVFAWSPKYGGIYLAIKQDGEWWVPDLHPSNWEPIDAPTHWRPLPPPPSPKKMEEGRACLMDDLPAAPTEARDE